MRFILESEGTLWSHTDSVDLVVLNWDETDPFLPVLLGLYTPQRASKAAQKRHSSKD